MTGPIVTNANREWAMALMPPWCQRGDFSDTCSETVDDGGWLDADKTLTAGRDKPSWSVHVAEQIEMFEKHYAGQDKPAAEWSSIWRKGWWPKVSARKRFPKSAPKELQPFFRAGTPEFVRALKAATKDERRIWQQFGIAQFAPDDPRLKKVQGGSAA